MFSMESVCAIKKAVWNKVEGEYWSLKWTKKRRSKKLLKKVEQHSNQFRKELFIAFIFQWHDFSPFYLYLNFLITITKMMLGNRRKIAWWSVVRKWKLEWQTKRKKKLMCHQKKSDGIEFPNFHLQSQSQ